MDLDFAGKVALIECAAGDRIGADAVGVLSGVGLRADVDDI